MYRYIRVFLDTPKMQPDKAGLMLLRRAQNARQGSLHLKLFCLLGPFGPHPRPPCLRRSGYFRSRGSGHSSLAPSIRTICVTRRYNRGATTVQCRYCTLNGRQLSLQLRFFVLQRFDNIHGTSGPVLDTGGFQSARIRWHFRTSGGAIFDCTSSAKEHPMISAQELEKREKALRMAIERILPDFVKSCRDETDVMLIHQDAFAADDEYELLGMAIKFAGLYGKEVRVIGKNRDTLKQAAAN
jgi:hypothetical protein